LTERSERVRAFVAAFNDRDFEALIEEVHDEAVLEEWPGAPGAETFRGPDGLRRAFEKWFESWEWMRADLEGIEESGDAFLVTLDQRAKGSASGVEVSIRSWNVYEFRGDKVIRVRMFIDRDAAMRAWDQARLEGAKASDEEKV
jgi:ketosteroid isomerase-like protein